MPEQHLCPHCVEWKWDDNNIWYNYIATSLGIRPLQLLWIPTLIVELLARKSLGVGLFYLVTVPVGCFLLAHLSSWCRRSVVGRYYFLFIGDDSQRHLHRRSPFDNDIKGLPSYELPTLASGVLRLKLGGLFRSNAVLDCKTWSSKTYLFQRWEAVGGSKGRIRVADNACTWFREHGGRIEGDPDYVLRFIDRFSSVQAALDERRRYEDAFDFLHRDLETLAQDIRVDRQGLGRSRHAQRARESLERSMKAACFVLAGLVDEPLQAAIHEAQGAPGYDNAVLERLLASVYTADEGSRSDGGNSSDG